MIIEHNDDGSLTVTIDKEIKVDKILRINPSEGWLGIESGLIKIRHILSQEDRQSVDRPDHEYAEYTHQIESDIDVYLQGQEGNDYASALHALDSQPWIVYVYTHDRAEWYTLPLDLFVDHTMMY